MTSHPTLKKIHFAVLAALLLTAACSSGKSDDHRVSTTMSTRSTAAASELSAKAQNLCRAVLSEQKSDAEDKVVVVDDTTSSMASRQVPAELSSQIEAASLANGSLTIVPVDGAGAHPTPVLLEAALSTPGERDRPSVRKLAALMPSCADLYLGTAKPAKSGSDVYTAMATASEVLTRETQLWTLSDMLVNSGRLAISENMLQGDPKKAARTAAKNAPLDLRGASWHVAGVGNSTVGLEPASRAWMLSFTQELCRTWNGSSCSDIALSPIPSKGEAPSGAHPDRPLSFPGVEQVDASAGCTYQLPGSITFEEDSARLVPGINQLVRGALRLIQENPDAQVRVIGHTASTSTTDGSGIRLSTQRATAVAGILRAGGAKAALVTAVGVGDTQPLAEDIDARTGNQIREAAARERRVEILVVGVGCGR
jgi:outer membrane protein OmpA-like peptidoglycan-associated protein